MIPDFVYRLTTERDWVDKHDALFDVTTKEQLVNHNAQVWFLTNVRIRAALAKLRSNIEDAISKGVETPRVNFRVLVKESRVTNKTLCKNPRVHWIRAEISAIKKISSNAEKSKSKLLNDHSSEIERFKTVEDNLCGQLLKEVNKGRDKDREIQRLSKIITLMSSKLKELEP
jgi:hypothetical protein